MKWLLAIALSTALLGCGGATVSTKRSPFQTQTPPGMLRDLDASVRHWTSLERRYRSLAKRLATGRRFGRGDNMLVVSKTLFGQLVRAVQGRDVKRGQLQLRLTGLTLRYEVAGVFFSGQLELYSAKQWVPIGISGYFHFDAIDNQVVARFVPLTLTLDDRARQVRAVFRTQLSLAALPRTLPMIPLPVVVSRLIKGARSSHRITLGVDDHRVMVIDQSLVIPISLSVI